MSDELSEEELENIVGGLPYEAAIERQKSVIERDQQAQQSIENMDTAELTEAELDQIRAGVPYIPEEEESMKL